MEYLGLSKDGYVVIFCTLRAADALEKHLAPGSHRCVSSQDIGLPIGVRALAVKRTALRKAIPLETGGGTARLVSAGWVIWAPAPARFEPGTPAIVNVIAFAKALQLVRSKGEDAFRAAAADATTADCIVRHDVLDGYSGRELLGELRRTLIGRDVSVPTEQGARPYVNLDNGASTPTFEPMWSAVCQTWRQPQNVQRALIPAVRSVVADVLGAPLSAYDVIFVSNTTEAINLVAESLRNESEPGVEAVVINTLLEHNSNELPWRTISGASPIRLSIDAEGFIDPSELDTILSEYNERGQHGGQRVRLVAVSGASNVLGTCNDMDEIVRIAHRYGARVLVDGAQLVAHRRVDIERSGIDFFAFSAHKAYAPFGAGALVARKGLLGFSPADLEVIRSSGEENAVGIAALGKALFLLHRIGFDVIQDEERLLTEQALRGMAQVPGLTVFGISDPDSPGLADKTGVIPFNLKGVISHTVARELAERVGIGVRSGCHCAHLTVKHLLAVRPWVRQLQGVIVALLPRVELPGVVRVSLGIENTGEDVDTLIRVLEGIATQRGISADGSSASVPDAMPATSQQDVRKQMDDSAEAAAQRVYAQSSRHTVTS
ncbi:MAG: aminotransferase class V-fold PLP-dependent enzyme [Coriobacteriia bacterium]|nr:aminotransferase class V-fold PLP-dependent enzyme [Coriobacteriia bacterium]